jgi:hypothetical protein
MVARFFFFLFFFFFFWGGGGGGEEGCRREIKSITVLANQWIDKLFNSLFSICSGR